MKALILTLEVAFVLLFLTGVALMYVPAALVIGGLLGAVAMERASARASQGRQVRQVAGESDRLRRVA